MGKLENIVYAEKMFLNLLGNIFSFLGINFVGAIMFPEVGKQGKIDWKHNVSATVFPILMMRVFGLIIFTFFPLMCAKCLSSRRDFLRFKVRSLIFLLKSLQKKTTQKMFKG